MIGAFMAYALVVSVLFGIAALGTEQVFALRRWPRRFVWTLTLAASLTFPLCMAFTTRPAVSVLMNRVPETLLTTVELSSKRSAPLSGRNAPTVIDDGLSSNAVSAPQQIRHYQVETVLGIAWPTMSAAALLSCALIWIRLQSITRRLPRIEVDGVFVRLSEATGPAVFGFCRPEILIPKWLLDAPLATRSMALHHERQHLAARDPLLLLGGLLLVALVPWNPALWWQLRRLRFAIEADCDARVLAIGVDPSLYAQMLLAVGQHRSGLPTAFMALTTPISWLERRIRLIVVEAGGLSGVLASSGIAVAVVLLSAAARLPAPGLAPLAELRKLPPQDTKPAAQWARAAAQSRFPELLDRHFEGSAVLAVVFNRNGSLKLIDKHLFPPGIAPTDFDMAAENQQLGVDVEDDILYRGGEYPDFTIGPWLESENVGRLFIVYEVLKWPHDPSRTRARVWAAIESYDPELFNLPPTDRTSWGTQVTVFMNDDGTMNRAQARRLLPGQSLTEDALERFAALGIRKAQLGRRGFASGRTERIAGPLFIDYAWPRRLDDPADVDELNTAWRAIFRTHPPKEDDGDDAALIERYFPDIQANGSQAVTTTIDGKQFRLTPWILLGRDGRVWDAGRWLNDVELTYGSSYVAGAALIDELEARYPGARIGMGNGWVNWRVKGVPIICLWIAPDSPAQRQADVDLRHRKDLLVAGAFVEEPDRPNPNSPGPLVRQFSYALNLGTPTAIATVRQAHPNAQVTASEPNALEVDIQVRTQGTLSIDQRQPPSESWTTAAALRIPYGATGRVDLFDTSTSPARRVQLVLRPQRLRDK